MKDKVIFPLNYYGGKKGMAKDIVKYIPDHVVYCEPFFGSGSVFFAKEQLRFFENHSSSLDISVPKMQFDPTKRTNVIQITLTWILPTDIL